MPIGYGKRHAGRDARCLPSAPERIPYGDARLAAEESSESIIRTERHSHGTSSAFQRTVDLIFNNRLSRHPDVASFIHENPHARNKCILV